MCPDPTKDNIEFLKFIFQSYRTKHDPKNKNKLMYEFKKAEFETILRNFKVEVDLDMNNLVVIATDEAFTTIFENICHEELY